MLIHCCILLDFSLWVLLNMISEYRINLKWWSILYVFLIWNFRRVLNIVCNLLGISPASYYWMPTFRNTLSVPSSKPLKMEQIKCSETSAFNNQTPGKYPKDYTQYSVCNFLNPYTPFPYQGPDILLRTLFWNPHSLCPSCVSVRDQIFTPTQNVGENYHLVNLTFMEPCIVVWLVAITNEMQLSKGIYYSTVH